MPQIDHPVNAPSESPTRRTWLARSAAAVSALALPFQPTSAQPARSASADGAVLAGSLRSSTEARLIQIYRAIAAGDPQALPLAAALARDVPGFRLGQLVYGDLLLARSGSFPGFSAAMDGPPAVRGCLALESALAQAHLLHAVTVSHPDRMAEIVKTFHNVSFHDAERDDMASMATAYSFSRFSAKRKLS